MARVTSKDVLGMAVGKTPANLKYDANKDGRITSADALAYARSAKGQASDKVAAMKERFAARKAASAEKVAQTQAAQAAKATTRKEATATRVATKKEPKMTQAPAPKTPAGPTQYGSMRTPTAPPPRGRFAKGGVAKKKVVAKKGKK